MHGTEADEIDTHNRNNGNNSSRKYLFSRVVPIINGTNSQKFTASI